MSVVEGLSLGNDQPRLEREETEGHQVTRITTDPSEVIVGASQPIHDVNIFGEEEELCGVCLERPEPGSYVELWCCGNVLCVNDAQQLGKCPFCREEPLVWNILR